MNETVNCDSHVRFYIRNMPAIDVADFCKKYGYEMYIGDDRIWIQKVDEVKKNDKRRKAKSHRFRS